MVEGVYAGLYKKVGNGKQPVLKGRRDTDFQNPFHFIRIQLQVLYMKREGLPAFAQDGKNQSCGKVLGNDAGSGNACYIPSA